MLNFTHWVYSTCTGYSMYSLYTTDTYILKGLWGILKPQLPPRAHALIKVNQYNHGAWTTGPNGFTKPSFDCALEVEIRSYA